MNARILIIVDTIKGHKSTAWAILLGIIIIALFLCISKASINNPTSTVLLGRDGSLLAASIAADQQYRFPHNDSVPEKFAKCIIEFEDRYFYHHPGINPVSIMRAAYNNIKAKRVVQGGSTITQQAVRLYRGNRQRTIWEKIVEAILSLRLEVGTSKSNILSMYTSNAPFGGNVVGLDAAAWRYFGRSASELSWAESAALAVLPNAPALVHPGRNPDVLIAKRNLLLNKLYRKGTIDSLTYRLSMLEPPPSEPMPLPQSTPHLLSRAIRDGFQGQSISTTIDPRLQERVVEIVNHHHEQLAANQIHNAAVLIIDIDTNSPVAYVGNVSSSVSGSYVDIITSSRSTGSILKPFLYAAMLNDGMILPRTLIADIPTQIGGYSPKNFNPGYDGAVPASRAIARSLNVPAVRMLQQYGVERFQHILQKLGLTTLYRSPSEYGLSLILGGAEASLWDLAGVYAGMARDLKNYRPYQSRYSTSTYTAPQYQINRENPTTPLTEHSVLSASSIFFTFEAMKEVARPDEQAGWQYFSSSRSVAWKTGTSYGHRDAWAIGLNPKYVVAVWVGNATGEGRPNLTGVSAAAPLMFDVFGLLPSTRWFEQPIDDMVQVPICRHSGHRASSICSPVDTLWIPTKGLETNACPYHRLVHLNQQKTHRVTDRCVSVSNMAIESWFALPPAMEWYYKGKNSFYKPIPPYLAGCEPEEQQSPMALLYPRIERAKIFIPRDFDGQPTQLVFEVAHSRPHATIHWHLNDEYLGSTQEFHKMAHSPSEGYYTLTLVDETGNTHSVSFSIE
ncbi:MAG: penicillin-binding protein 1C [Tenuifilaceae bacterium]|jgi:penicillin-binding protein 1C|nr:penicillin-binding protein 1C [Tenuifilaceae bacterium]